MQRKSLLTAIALFPLTVTTALAQTDTLRLSLGEALERGQSHNLSLAIAREGTNMARATKGELNSFWYPTVTLAGEYSHSLSEIAVVGKLSDIGGSIASDVGTIAATNPLVAGIAEAIGESTFSLPLVPRNTALVGLDVVWTIFSGGRRVEASRLSDALLRLADERVAATSEAVSAGIVEAYFGVALATENVRVRREALGALDEHLRQARRLEEEGFIRKTERLVAEVNAEQAATLLQGARSELRSAQEKLAQLIGIAGNTSPLPTTPLFLPTTIPTVDSLLGFVASSPTIGALGAQSEIASHRLNMERSRYLPTVALVGHQQLWSSGLDEHLVPRTIVGVGMSWTLFDGLSRRSSISRIRSELSTADKAREDAEQNISLTLRKLHRALLVAHEQYTTSLAAERLTAELVRSERRAFAEGMATSLEVVDAELMHAEARLSTALALYTIDTSLALALSLCGKSSTFATYMPQVQ